MKQDWKLTNQAAFILLMNLRGSYSDDLIRLGGNTIETLKKFFQSHLIIRGRQDTLHQEEMLQAIADSMGDTTQTQDVTVYVFSILPKLNMGPNSSPLDGVISNDLRAKWDLNSLTLNYGHRDIVREKV